MNASLQMWLFASVDAAAAIAFLHIGRRLANKGLLGVGLAFVTATLLIAGEPFHQSPAAVACGYALGFASSLLGFLGLLKTYAERHRLKGDG